jgi:lipoate-protein ligase A
MVWRLLQDDGVAAAEGLAADEVLARRAGENGSPPTLRLYTYRPHAVLVGRFQDIEREVHVEAAEKLGLELNRRPTGGGAILMGPDQLGVALALHGRAGSPTPPGMVPPKRARERMARFSDGLRRALASLGIEAAFRGKNDLEVDGRKIAGLGIHRDGSGGLLFHASLLIDLDVALMARVLRTPFVEITDAKLAAVARRTTTVRELAGEGLSLADVRAHVARGFAASFDVELELGALDSDERKEVAALTREKYETRDWVFQRTDVRDSTGTASIETSGGRLDVSVALAGRMIKAVNVRGDFFESEGALADLEGRLRWTPSEKAAVAKTVHRWARAHSTGTVEADPLARAVVSAAQRARSQGAPYGCFVTPGAREDRA